MGEEVRSMAAVIGESRAVELSRAISNSVSHAMYQQVQTADDKQPDADDRIYVEKRGIYAGKVVGPHEQMLVNQQAPRPPATASQ